jgi:hypothetical protein
LPGIHECKPSYQELKDRIKELEAEIDGFWEAAYYGYLMETREEVEADCKESWAEGTSPLAVALHFIWKRKPKVADLERQLAEAKAKSTANLRAANDLKQKHIND